MTRISLNIKYGSDKLDDYLKHYQPILDFYNNRQKTMYLLELGVHRGGSLLFWRDYMSQGIITGIDVKISEKIAFRLGKEDRIHVFQGDQTDVGFLSSVAAKTAPDGYDVIIDDASHIGHKSKTTYWHLFDNHLKPGGYYFIEDWGTGYWDDHPDGEICDLDAYRRDMKSLESHTCGMVGFVKQLVDETAAADITRKRFSGTAQRQSKISNMTIFPSVIVVQKASAG